MHAISSYRGNKPTNTHTNKQTNPQTGLITTHCAAKLSVQCNKYSKQRTSDEHADLVLPAPPSPTSISLVRLHSTEPICRRRRKPIVAVKPRRTISFGGVFRDAQPRSGISSQAKPHTFTRFTPCYVFGNTTWVVMREKLKRCASLSAYIVFGSNILPARWPSG